MIPSINMLEALYALITLPQQDGETIRSNEYVGTFEG